MLHIGVRCINMERQPPDEVLCLCYACGLFNVHGLVMRVDLEAPHASLLRYLLVVNILVFGDVLTEHP